MRTARAPRTTWRAGWGGRLLAASLAVLVAAALQDDLTGSPTWWRITAQVLGLAGFGSVVLRTLVWRITATPQGLRIRTLGSVRTVPWEATKAAVAVRTGTLTLVGACGTKATVVDYAGFRRPRRLAAEIGAMIADPALRPAL